MKVIRVLGMLLLAAIHCVSAATSTPRSIPKPLTNHPGNVFLLGQEVVLRVRDGQADPWHVMTYEDKELATVHATEGQINLGRLPVGFYRLRGKGLTNWISCAVLVPLKAPTPPTSPVALDVAMAWFYPPEKMDAVASLCALAGVNQVRDRLAWGHMEPKQGAFAGHNRYDDSARAQAQAGLQVLQVNHSSPRWANPNGKRFPPDLRDAYRFYREMARRWRGQVAAFEPWNEADIPGFGGHTGAEMAAMQKASHLGLKAGNPDVIVCQNVFASHNRAQLEDLHANAAWPYFDTFNLHHYAPFDEYPKLYANFRAVSAGRPLWVTECARPVKWAGDEKLKEPTDADLRVQAERVAKTFASSLHEGSAATFYFLLPHYVEGQTQFGILRPDLTPRPAYVALAAVGRLLADARPLGRLQTVPGTVRAFLFRAKPDGQGREVLVAWTTTGETNLSLPLTPAATFDHLGRAQKAANQVALTEAPLFAVLPEGSAQRFQLQPPPPAPERLPGQPSPVAIQALWPEEKTVLKNSAYRISSEQSEPVTLFVYNFSKSPVTGRLDVAAPKGWRVGPLQPLTIAPMDRAQLRLELDCRDGSPEFVQTVRVAGDFGSAGQPVLSMRLMPEPNLLWRQAGTPIPDAGKADSWRSMISGGGPMKFSEQDGAVMVEAEPKGPDKWAYPRLTLPANGRPPAGCKALCCTLTLIEGEAQFRAIFDEAGGAGYVVDFLAQPKPGQTVEAVALLENAAFGAGWSKPDPNHRLDIDQIAGIKIGCNTKGGRVTFAIKRLRWVKY